MEFKTLDTECDGGPLVTVQALARFDYGGGEWGKTHPKGGVIHMPPHDAEVLILAGVVQEFVGDLDRPSIAPPPMPEPPKRETLSLSQGRRKRRSRNRRDVQ